MSDCNYMNGSLPGSSVDRILQARILEWVDISLSRGDRDLGVAFQTHPGRQAFISLEDKSG